MSLIVVARGLKEVARVGTILYTGGKELMARRKRKGPRAKAAMRKAYRAAKKATAAKRGTSRKRQRASKVTGITGALQRIIPGGATGYTADIERKPGWEGLVQRIIPGGETGFQRTDLTPDYHGGVVRSWMANGAIFNKNADGTITVQKKDGSLKTYRPYKPTVFGKEPDARKFIKMAKKHKKVYQELHKIFKTKGRK